MRGTPGKCYSRSSGSPRSSVIGTSVFTRTVSPDRRGRYAIDGITLTIDYADGSRHSMIIVTDPSDPESVIWLDGRGFTKGR